MPFFRSVQFSCLGFYLVIDPEEGCSWVIFSYYKHLRLYLPYQLQPLYSIAYFRLSSSDWRTLVSAIFVFILQWGASLLNGNQFISINIHNIENAVRNIDFYDFLINGVICFILTSSALKFKISDLRSYWKQISILATIALVICAVLLVVYFMVSNC